MEPSLAGIVDYVNGSHRASWTPRRKLSGGYHLGAYELAGPNATRAVLKWWPAADPREDLAATARAIATARLAGWPTPEWLAYGAVPDGSEYLVEEFIDGSELTGFIPSAIDQVLAANRIQAGRRPDTRRNWSETVRRIVFEGANGCTERMRAHPEGARLLRRVEELTAGEHRLRLPSDDLVHGDFSAVNVLVRDGTCYFIDADHAGRGSRAIDLADFLTGARVGFYSPELLDSDARRLAEECVALVGRSGLRLCIAATVMGLVAFALDHSSKAATYIARCHQLLDMVD